MAKKKGKKKNKIDIDALFREDDYEPPKINFRRALELAKKNGNARAEELTYESFANALKITNSKNINKWLKEDGLSFETIKMMMYVLNCKIEDLIDPPRLVEFPKKRKNKKL